MTYLSGIQGGYMNNAGIRRGTAALAAMIIIAASASMVFRRRRRGAVARQSISEQLTTWEAEGGAVPVLEED